MRDRAVALSVLCFSTIVLAVPSVASVEPAVVYSLLSGHWIGSLEYRDFQSDKRVALPTTLDATPTADGSAIQFAYTYDDGPSKIVKEKAVIRIPASGDRYVVKDEDGEETVYQIESANNLNSATGGTLVLSGSGTDNKQSVDVRTTLEVTPQSLSILRETRRSGEEFKFRHQYRFTRLVENQGKS